MNAANSSLAGGGGVDGAIHRAAGHQLVEASRALAPCQAGNAVITPGFNLAARYVIHAVGPIWQGGKHGEPELLRRAYERSFELALAQGDIKSIAFPAISTGAYQFPKAEAARIATDVMLSHAGAFDRVVACMFDDAGVELYQRILKR